MEIEHADSVELEEETGELPEGHSISAEVAEAEFARFAEAMDLDVDPETMDADDRRDFEGEKRRFVRALERGYLVVDDRGQPVYTPQSSPGGPLTFREPDGAALMETDRAKKGRNVKAQNLLLAAVTKQSPARFAKMKSRDLKVCNAILNLFLGG